MQLLVLSDTHFEFMKDEGRSFTKSLRTDVDAVILAGDICGFDQIVETLALFCGRYKRVFYIPGNHELYGSNPWEVEAVLYEAEVILHNLVTGMHGVETTWMGQHFVLATLWFAPSTAPKQCLNDFHQIRGYDPWVFEEHEKHLAFLEAHVTGQSVVVTHHLPTYRSVHPRYAGSPFNAFFATEQEGLILDAQPKAWVHGHTHESMDYLLGNTRIVCNPYGYMRVGENPRFRDDFILEV